MNTFTRLEGRGLSLVAWHLLWVLGQVDGGGVREPKLGGGWGVCSALVGLSMEGTLVGYSSCLLSLGISEPWEGQSL